MMGEVVVLLPVMETLVFDGEADQKSKFLFEQMIAAARSLISAQCTNKIDQLNQEIEELQKRYAEVKARFGFITDVLDKAHEDRSLLWSVLPDGEAVPLVHGNDDATRFAVMLTRRRFATITCLDFELVEKTEDGCEPFFNPKVASG
jgi:hypothetical protein